MCRHYTCDCLAEYLSITFGECNVVMAGSMDQTLTCTEDSTDPEPFQNRNICPTATSSSSEADTGMIIGIVVGAIVLIAIVGFVLYRRSQKTL